LTTSLTVETGTVRGEGVGGGERGAAMEDGTMEDGGAGVLLNAGAGSMLLEGEHDPLSVFKLVELSKAEAASS